MNGVQDSKYENDSMKSDENGGKSDPKDDENKSTKESVTENNLPTPSVNNELNGLSNDINVSSEEQPANIDEEQPKLNPNMDIEKPNIDKVKLNVDETSSNKDIEMDEERLLSDTESVGSGSMNEDKLLNSDDDSVNSKVVVSSAKDILTNGNVEETKVVNNETNAKTESKENENSECLPTTDKETEPLTKPAEGNSSNTVKSKPDSDSVPVKKENTDMEIDGENVTTVTTNPGNDKSFDVRKTDIKEDNAEITDDDVPMDDVVSSETDEERRATRLKFQIDRVESLKEELRGEESTLTLLRKLFDSQRGKGTYKSTSKLQSSMPTNHSKQAQMQVQPPQQQQKVNMPLKQPPPVQQKPPSHNSGQPVQKFYIQVGNQLVPAPPPSNTSANATNYQYVNGTTPHSYQPQPPPKPAAPPKQTPEQKKNAAKAALRRQLEQTLLQIPPPRPPAADWKAVPNVNSMDFMMLVGLDEVVDTILDMDNKPTLKKALEELTPYNPRICSQCQVDFSPCWKAAKDNNLDGFVLCERCALQNVKKVLKAEHTSRLKSAFIKALKQEQEIEDKIKAGEDVNIAGIAGSEKQDNAQSSHSPNTVSHQPASNNRNSSPKLAAAPAPSASHGGHVPSPPERHHQHQPSSGHHHRHQVVQHYPHHTSLVQQLHHQHIQQQQLELEPPPSRHSSRWHPYMQSSSSSSHHRDHHPVHHRSYVPASSNEGSPRQEYYVVHHPHQNVRYVTR